MTVLLTGVAGFIGYHVARVLLDRGDRVIGLDNVNDYYDVALKRARLAELAGYERLTVHEVDIAHRKTVEAIVAANPDITGVIHLAAQAGVRYSLINPYAYVEANITGHLTLLEACKALKGLEHFVYASSSSVYGGNTTLPFAVEDRVDTPVSLYAATKKSCELISHTYAHLYGIKQTGLRFFTVYGPWGRPDMAAYIFTRKIFAGEPIEVFNNGAMQRDFTYIDDIVAGVVAVLDRPPEGEGVPARVYNIGNHRSEPLMRFIGVLEAAIGREAVKEMKPMQPGDVPATYADIEATRRDFGFEPKTTIDEGLPRFVAWYRDYHGV